MRSIAGVLIAVGAVLLGVCAHAEWRERAFQREATLRLERIGRAPSSALGTRAVHARREVSRTGIFGRLTIPRLGLSAAVAEGVDPQTLDRAVGHLPGTAFAGEPGNVALAGHRDTFFRRLDRLKPGDRVRLSTPDGEFDYRVTRLRVVSPRNTRVLRGANSARLTLITCYPLRAIGPAPDRLVVEARALASSSAFSASRTPSR